MSNSEDKSVIDKFVRGVIAIIVVAAFVTAVFLNALQSNSYNFKFTELSIWLLFFLAFSAILNYFKGSKLMLAAILARLGVKIPANGHEKLTKS